MKDGQAKPTVITKIVNHHRRGGEDAIRVRALFDGILNGGVDCTRFKRVSDLNRNRINPLSVPLAKLWACLELIGGWDVCCLTRGIDPVFVYIDHHDVHRETIAYVSATGQFVFDTVHELCMSRTDVGISHVIPE